MGVADSVRATLTAIGKTDTALGASALVLAERLDRKTTADTAVAAMTKELRATLAELTKDAPAKGDPVDELRERRERRRRGA